METGQVNTSPARSARPEPCRWTGRGEPCGESTRLAWVLGIWLVAVLGSIHQERFDGPTPASRLDLLFAIVRHGTLAIDPYHENTPDKAWHAGHYYSDKAPGTVVVALPGFWLAHEIVQQVRPDGVDRTVWLAGSWAACAASQALPAALGGCLLWIWLGRLVRARAAWVAVMALWLGSLPLPYSTMLFSHAQTIGLISVALWALALFEDPPPRRSGDDPTSRPTEKPMAAEPIRLPGWRHGLAGGCLGLSLASEYTAGLVVVALGLFVIWRRRRGGLWFLVGVVPPLLLVPAYSWATVGVPWELPYSYQASFPEMAEGLYAIQWPDLENLLRLLFGPTRGLVFWTPFLLLAGLGWVWMARERPAWLWLTYVVPLLQVVVISGRTWDWQAGYTLSARYLSPILPLVALPCALGMQRWPTLGAVLAALSVGMVTLATVTDACPVYDVAVPLSELHIPRLLRGEFTYNALSVLCGFPPGVAAGLYAGLLVAGLVWGWRASGRSDAWR